MTAEQAVTSACRMRGRSNPKIIGTEALPKGVFATRAGRSARPLILVIMKFCSPLVDECL